MFTVNCPVIDFKGILHNYFPEGAIKQLILSLIHLEHKMEQHLAELYPLCLKHFWFWLGSWLLNEHEKDDEMEQHLAGLYP